MNVFTNIVTVIKLKTGFCFIAWWSYDAINSKYLTFFPFPIKFLIMNVFFFFEFKSVFLQEYDGDKNTKSQENSIDSWFCFDARVAAVIIATVDANPGFFNTKWLVFHAVIEATSLPESLIVCASFDDERTVYIGVSSNLHLVTLFSTWATIDWWILLAAVSRTHIAVKSLISYTLYITKKRHTKYHQHHKGIHGENGRKLEICLVFLRFIPRPSQLDG